MNTAVGGQICRTCASPEAGTCCEALLSEHERFMEIGKQIGPYTFL